jgi:hypothetical protein
VKTKSPQSEIDAVVNQLKGLVEKSRLNQRKYRDLLKTALSKKQYRQMQVETIRWLFEVFGDDPEQFAMMYEEHLDEDGSIVPELEVIQEYFPEDFKRFGLMLSVVVDNQKGTRQ